MNKLIKKATQFATKNSPTILTVFGVIGLGTTVGLAINATPKAILLLDEAREQNGDLTAWETVKTAYQCYIPTAAVGLATVACIIGSNSINIKRNTAIAGLYTLTDRAFKEYQHQVIEQIGEKKHREIKDGMAKKMIKDTKDAQASTIIIDGSGVLFYDPISGRYFRSTVNKILQIKDMLYHRMRTEMVIPLNNFYYELNIPEILLGDTNGWTIENGPIDISFSTMLTENNEPCAVIEWEVVPLFTYD